MTTAVPLEEYCVNPGAKYEDTKLEKLVVRHLLTTFILPVIQFTKKNIRRWFRINASISHQLAPDCRNEPPGGYGNKCSVVTKIRASQRCGLCRALENETNDPEGISERNRSILTTREVGSRATAHAFAFSKGCLAFVVHWKTTS